MLYSMTGFGRAEQMLGDRQVMVDLRSLNGKQFDLRLQAPSLLKPYEIQIRNLLNEQLERGSVECSIYLKGNGTNRPVTIDNSLVAAYYEPLFAEASAKGWDTSGLLAAILKMPDVMTPVTEQMSEADFDGVKATLMQAIDALNKHRLNEGAVLQNELMLRINNIAEAQKKVQELDPLRRNKIREHLLKLLEENVGREQYDANRLEQELIYYIERIDITEEQVRLTNHLQYFAQLLTGPERSKGKKIGFILQELGREINTTGSKANDAAIQQIVVNMKDELEKAKEQVLNVL